MAKHHSDRRVLETWTENAAAWTDAVRGGRIGSRVRVTDRALLEAIFEKSVGRLLDVGCGEGWLARAVTGRGLDVIGIDAVDALIAGARAGGGGRFETLDYERLADEGPAGPFDAIVCNFSLLGARATEAVVAAAAGRLAASGRVIVQTLHPVVACGDAPYRDGWRDGSWDGIEGDFGAAAPWYFRTLESWIRLFRESGLGRVAIREPIDPATDRPASVIFVATPDRGR